MTTYWSGSTDVFGVPASRHGKTRSVRVCSNPLPVSGHHLLLAAGRRDRQVLGPQRQRAAWARRLRRPGLKSARSLPTELQDRVTRAGPTCSDSCSCSVRAAGGGIPSIDLGAGRSAVAVSSGGQHTCALLVRSPRGRSHTQRATRWRTSAAAAAD